MKTLLLFSIFGLTLSPLIGQSSASFSSDIFEIDGKKYKSLNPSLDKIKSTWNSESSKNPPVSYSQAYKKARASLEKLRPGEPWIVFLAQFLVFKEGASYFFLFERVEKTTDSEIAADVSHEGARMSFTVLMDGSVISPLPIK